ncbi:GRIM-19 protein [Colletotrichum limetticola]|uniref:NADH dehydrogenase [ubiquinone] 1 alpha subcomplex subunit 13 n=1 Tax=Colletotrichum limetticola TaxID=1209924 RepID=A0ABQ9Q0A5_9PEZI|nr:GRIM-19 protein [Colletotrichum limetticola]
MPQDMPPVGGYQAVQYKVSDYGVVEELRESAWRVRESQEEELRRDDRNHADYWKQRNLPARGFRPGTMLIGMGLVMGYGWYQLTKGIREANELAREKMWARIHLIPLLQAEEDRDQVRRWYADQAREKELLGENTKVYHNERFIRPTFALAPQSKN